jgi:lipopolysaccharide export system protein LptC
MAYKNTFVSLAILSVILLAGMTLSYHSREVPIPQPTLLPDAYMENVTAIIMDKKGKPSIKIKTPRMVHFIENDTSELIDPQLTIYRRSPEPWFITSKFAKAQQGIDQVDFWKDVIIHHAGDLTSPATIITTPTLTVHPNDQTAETTDFITFTQPSVTVKAIGMTADLNTGSIKLLSQTRGEYVSGS